MEITEEESGEAEEEQEEEAPIRKDSGLFSSEALRPSKDLMPSNNLFGGFL